MRWMCGMLDVSPSGYYGWVKRAPSARTRTDERWLRHIRSIVASNGYGARRVWRCLRAAGFDGGLHRVERLMRQAGLNANAIERF